MIFVALVRFGSGYSDLAGYCSAVAGIAVARIFVVRTAYRDWLVGGRGRSWYGLYQSICREFRHAAVVWWTDGSSTAWRC